MMTYRKIEKAKEKSNEKYKTIVRNQKEVSKKEKTKKVEK